MVNVFKVVAETFRRVTALSSVDSYSGGGGWFGIIREAWSGAWQANVSLDAPKNILAFSAVYACVTLAANDVAKCCIKIIQEGTDGIETAVEKSPFLAVLMKPNSYQTRMQFIEQWVIQKLLHGNAYVLKIRESVRGLVQEMHVLDAQRVKTLVADDGSVFYQVASDHLAGVDEGMTFPASEIIHDRMPCLFHPLVGVSPIYACAMSATMGNKIQANSLRVFKNMSRPSGHLTAPGKIDTETATRMKKDFEENYGGENLSRIMVTGAGLEYKPILYPSAVDAQLIEQLKFSVEDVARSFHMPLFKIGGAVPQGSSIEQLDLVYYKDCLQTLFEALECCLDDGLELPTNYCTEFDLEGLLRMDPSVLVKTESEAVKGGIKAPNEARKKLNLKPVPGGESPYLQEQNYSLAALAKRDAKPDPFASATPTPRPAGEATPPAPVSRSLMEEFAEVVLQRMRDAALALPAPAADQVSDDEITFFAAAIQEDLHVAA